MNVSNVFSDVFEIITDVFTYHSEVLCLVFIFIFCSRFIVFLGRSFECSVFSVEDCFDFIVDWLNPCHRICEGEKV